MYLWHTIEIEEVYNLLATSVEGLTEETVLEQRKQFGTNEIKKSPSLNLVTLFLQQFTSLVVLLLLAAALTTALLGEWTDAVVILSIVTLNAVIGFYQEYSAEKALTALKSLTVPQAKVRRNGILSIIAARDLVPGDIITLEAGDHVPADARIIAAHSLACNEAALTGESLSTNKDHHRLSEKESPLSERSNMLYMGTSVSQGFATAVVVAIGMSTELGQIAYLLEQKDGKQELSPLQQRIGLLSKQLGIASIVLVAIVFLLGLLRSEPSLELLMLAVSLAVAAVPEGLLAVVTIALALGVRAMARERAIVRKLEAIENLGATTVICTDKTGTLTEGIMAVRKMWFPWQEVEVYGEPYSPEGEVMISSALQQEVKHLALVFASCTTSKLLYANEQWSFVGDPTEAALLGMASKLEIFAGDIDNEQPIFYMLPFDSERKMMSIVRHVKDGVISFVKGAPEQVLDHCTHVITTNGTRELTVEDKRAISLANKSYASQGMRVLAAAERHLTNVPEGHSSAEDALTFYGLAIMSDPPRAEAREAVHATNRAGIRVIMITGDQPRTALAIAKELGIASSTQQVLEGKNIDQLTEGGLAEKIEDINVIARATASHKFRIVQALQARREVVAMTGDGVNDAPALQGANVGIAMGKSGTDVAKESSDIIITDDNFASIVHAIAQGRGIYLNIRKTIRYLLTSNASELMIMGCCFFIGLPVPLTAIHLLWINLVTDGLPALALAAEKTDRDLMALPPQDTAEKIADKRFLYQMFLSGSFTAVTAVVIYWYILQHHSYRAAQTSLFCFIVFSEILRSLANRDEERHFWQLPYRNSYFLLSVIAISLVFQVAVVRSTVLSHLLNSTVLSFELLGVVILTSILPLLSSEAIKRFMTRQASYY